MSSKATSLQSNRALRGSWRAKTFALATVVAGAALALAACGSSASTSPGNGAASSGSAPIAPAPAGAELTTARTALGTILVNGQGRAVYRFAADTKGHSNCNGSCLQYWPAVTSSQSMPTSASGVTAGLGVITRSDGLKQLTVNGWPVYTFAGDNAPGVPSGQGTTFSGGLWWVISSSGAEIKAKAGSANSTPSPSRTTRVTPSPSMTSSSGGW